MLPLIFFDKALTVLSAISGGVSISSLATVIDAPVGIAITGFSFAVSLTAGTTKKLLKITRNKKRKYKKTVILVRSKWNRIESTTSKASIDNEISPEEFATIINEEGNYRELKEWWNIRMMKSQRSDIKRSKLVEDGKRIGINEINKQNEKINSIKNVIILLKVQKNK